MNALQDLRCYPQRIGFFSKGRVVLKKKTKRPFVKPTYVALSGNRRYRVVPASPVKSVRASDRASTQLAPFVLSDGLCRKILESSLSSNERLKASESAAMARLITSEFNGALADFASLLAERGVQSKPAFHYTFCGWAADPDFWFILTDSLILDPNLTSSVVKQLAAEIRREEGSVFNYSWGKLVSTRKGLEVSPVLLSRPPISDIEIVG